MANTEINSASKLLVLRTNDSYQKNNAFVYVKQFDANSRYVKVDFRDEDGHIPLAGTVQLNVTKPDGTKCYIGGTIDDDGYAVVKLTAQSMAVVGQCSCDISVFSPVEGAEDYFLGDGETTTFVSNQKLVDVTGVDVNAQPVSTGWSYSESNYTLTFTTAPASGDQITLHGTGTQLLTSATFYLIVEESNYSEGAIESQDEFSTISVIIANLSKYVALSQSYAVGGTGTREGEDTDNSKYYSEQSSAAGSTATQKAAEAAQSATAAAGSATTAGQKATEASQSATSAAGSASTATQKATEASSSASAASQSASSASSSASTATQKATAAGNSATAAAGSATTASNKALDAEAWAVGQRNGTDVPSSDPTYENNSKYWAGVAEDNSEIAIKIRDGEIPAARSRLTEGIETNRVIEDADVSCPDITFGTTGGDAEIQTGQNKFKFLFGKSKKWNQMLKDTTTSATLGGVTFARTGQTIRVTGTATAYSDDSNVYIFSSDNMQEIQGHKYFILNDSTYDTYIYGATVAGVYSGKRWFTASASGAFNITLRRPSYTVGTVVNDTIHMSVIDVTAIYGAGNEPTTWAEFEKEYPLAYYGYNESTILSAKSSELVSVGENQWDEQWEVGEIQDTTGQNVNSSTVIRSKNYTRVEPGTAYYFTSPKTMTVYQYDANQKFLGQSTNFYAMNTEKTLDENCYYIRFKLVSAYGTTYNHDISIYICWDTPGRPYVANRTDRVTLPNIELRSVGEGANEIRDEAYQEGGGKRYIGTRAITSDDSFIKDAISGQTTTRFYLFGNVISNAKDTTLTNALHAKLPCLGAPGTAYGKDQVGFYINEGRLFVKLNVSTVADAKAYLLNTVFQYELTTPTDIPTSENPGWTELVYTDNYGTLQFLTDPAQIPQVPQPYYIEYTVSLTDFLDAAYAHTDGDATKIALKQDVEDIVNGNTPAGKALLADNLESNNKIEDLLPYTMRQAPSGVGKSMLLDHLTGATVAWNQQTPNNVNNTYSFTPTAYSGQSGYKSMFDGYVTDIPVGHKVFVHYKTTGWSSNIDYVTAPWFGTTLTRTSEGSLSAIVSVANNTYKFCRAYTTTLDTATVKMSEVMIIDLTQMFGSTIANFLYNQGTAGINKFRTLFPKPYYPYNAGQLVGVKTAGRKAVQINQWDEQWETGNIDVDTGANITANNCIRSKNFCPIIPGSTIYCQVPYYITSYGLLVWTYDANYQPLAKALGITGGNYNAIRIVPEGAAYFKIATYNGNYGGTYHNDICINYSDPAINGTFYPYEADEYPCEEVELNGVYTLDSNNNIVAVNGDTYGNDGTVARKWGITDLGNCQWMTYSSGTAGTFYAQLNSNRADTSFALASALCNKLTNVGTSKEMALDNNSFSLRSDSKLIFAKVNSSITTTSAFKEAVTGMLVVYELTSASQTEETASSFASTQKTGTTEQFMEPELAMPVFLPVGHDSFYLPDLKEKVEDAPESPTTDGTYLVSRSGGTNVYIPIANVTATQSEIDEIIEILQ